ncbi:MAG TPA: hypothetical protein ENG87_05810 [Candidatus Pacearchaeota archaeon]|nr:hypothetical protein BMS3Abin17_00080 [archaeon BMS3Abin17]HDK42871.1 hypothetical protein [Candidatus Pacearchaeota archaeon]HDZ60172.1 hypothetical protein [Candidatus Pacearchaeota archaeon]
MNEDLGEEEAKEILRQFSESKQNVHTFFTNIIKADDTTKVGFLSEGELGIPSLPIRTTKELELFSKDVWSQDAWAKYFKKLSEITTSTSLSKEGILIKLSVTQKKELADVTPSKKKNKGWFRKKDDSGGAPVI